jgi:hypothetical protein
MSERERVIEWATAREATEHHSWCNSHRDEPCDCYRRQIYYVAAHDYLVLLAELEQAERKIGRQYLELQRVREANEGLAVGVEQAEKERDGYRDEIEMLRAALREAKQ